MNLKKSTLRAEPTSSDLAKILHQLRIQWWTVGFCCLFCVLVCFVGLSSVWQPGYARWWLLQTFAVLAYVFGTLRSYLSANHHKHDMVLLPTFGVGTLMTICRGVFISMLAGFLFLPWPTSTPEMFRLNWVPGVLYILAACADYVDGYLARMTKHETSLGEIFDTKMDALGLLIVPLVAISSGQLPIFYAAVGGAYYVFIFGIWLRKRYGKSVIELQPRPGARMLAGFQMGLVGVALLPVFSPPATTIAAVIFMIPFLAGFVRDWLVVCGRIDQNSTQWVHREQTIYILLTKYLPLCLRLLVLWVGWMIFWHAILHSPPKMGDISNHILSLNMFGTKFYDWKNINIIALIMIVFGIMGRIAALLLSFSTGYQIMNDGLIRELVLMFSCSLVLMLSGTGALSIWKPEDAFLFKRAGERE